MRFIAKKAAERFEGAFGGNPFQQPQESRTENTTFDTTSSSKNRTSTKVVGEYVDFEEIE